MGTKTAEVEVEVAASKPITFRASAKTEKLVKELPGAASSSRGLSAYLSLPLDQYSLLDPGWISRCPGSPDMFVLRIPLFDLVGLEVQPQISVRVAADPRNSQVHFMADQFKLGDPRFDADLKLAMRATLRNKPVPTLRPFRTIRNMWSRTRSGRNGGATDGAATGMEGGGGSQQAQAAGSAAATASVRAQTSNSGAVPSDEEDPFLGAEESDEEGSGSVRRRHSYNPDAVLDVGMGGGGGARGLPDLPPHVAVVRDEWQAAGNGLRSSSHASAVADRNTSSSSSSSSSSSNRSSGSSGSSGSAGSTARGAGAGSDASRHASCSGAVASGAGRGCGFASNGEEAQSEASSRSGGVGVQLPTRTAAGSVLTEVGAQAVCASSAAVRHQSDCLISPGTPAAHIHAVEVESAPAVSSAPAAPDAGSLPFIEDSVLYVPASQWGQAEAASSTSGAAGGARRSAGAGGHGISASFRPAMAEVIAPEAGGSLAEARPVAQGSSGRGCGGGHADAAGATGGLAGTQRLDPPSSAPSGAAPHAATSAVASSKPSVGTRPDDASDGSCSTSSRLPTPEAGQGTGREPALSGQVLHAGMTGGSEDGAPETPNAATAGTGHARSSSSSADANGRGAPGSNAQHATGGSAGTSASSGTGAAADEGPTALLEGSVDVAVTVMVPPALAAVPRPLLGMTGSLIARYAISSLLPSFLDLLAADYGRWASGQTVSARATPAGDLAATAAANAAAMGGAAGLSGAQQAFQAAGEAPVGAAGKW